MFIEINTCPPIFWQITIRDIGRCVFQNIGNIQKCKLTSVNSYQLRAYTPTACFLNTSAYILL